MELLEARLNFLTSNQSFPGEKLAAGEGPPDWLPPGCGLWKQLS